MSTRFTEKLLSILAVVLVSIALFAPSSVAGETDGAAAEKKAGEAQAAESAQSPILQAARGKGDTSAASETKVYGNEDLERLFGSGASPSGGDSTTDRAATPAAPTGSVPGGQDALDELLNRRQNEIDGKKQTAVLEEQVDAARRRVADLEKRLLAIRNPLLPRPSAPEENVEEWNAASAPQRVASTQKELDRAREELTQLEQKLAR